MSKHTFSREHRVNMYYYKEMVAAYYDCDHKNLLKLSGMLRYMQQASSEQMQNQEMSPEKLFSEGMVFLLSKSNMKVHRYPVCSEKIRVGTAATHTKGARYIREFVIDSVEGDRLVSAYTLWLLTDIANHRIMRPRDYPYQFPFQTPQLEESVGDIPLPKLKEISPDAPVSRMTLPVRYSHIDINRHVNNAMYADFICDALPYKALCEGGISTLALSFVGEAQHGDQIVIETTELGKRQFYITGAHDRGVCFETLVEL